MMLLLFTECFMFLQFSAVSRVVGQLLYLIYSYIVTGEYTEQIVFNHCSMSRIKKSNKTPFRGESKETVM